MVKVLVLDDEPARHDLFLRIFKGAEVTPAYSEAEAIRALSAVAVPFDVVTLDHDLGMSAGDGMGVARHIARMPRAQRPRQVLVHTANPVRGPAMLDTLRRAGIDAQRVDPLEMARRA